MRLRGHLPPPLSYCLTLSLSASAKRRIVRGDADPFAGTKSILWFAAHPDDEVVVAPLLASLCRDRSLRCTLIVLTRGEKGDCLLTGGCQPDVATVRSGEMGRASEFFGANLVLLNFSDGGGLPDGSAPEWDARAGGHDQLVASIASLIESFEPDVVLTFDPRHGTTCHNDHRAAGKLAKEALSKTSGSAVLSFSRGPSQRQHDAAPTRLRTIGRGRKRVVHIPIRLERADFRHADPSQSV